MEKDDEIKGAGNSLTTEFRMNDPRIGGRWWSRDPIVKPWTSPYSGYGNNPILFIDPSGLEDLTSKYNAGEDVTPHEGDTRQNHKGYNWTFQDGNWVNDVKSENVVVETDKKPGFDQSGVEEAVGKYGLSKVADIFPKDKYWTAVMDEWGLVVVGHGDNILLSITDEDKYKTALGGGLVLGGVLSNVLSSSSKANILTASKFLGNSLAILSTAISLNELRNNNISKTDFAIDLGITGVAYFCPVAGITLAIGKFALSHSIYSRYWYRADIHYPNGNWALIRKYAFLPTRMGNAIRKWERIFDQEYDLSQYEGSELGNMVRTHRVKRNW